MPDFVGDAVAEQICWIQPWPPRLWILNQSLDGSICHICNAARRAVGVFRCIPKDFSAGCDDGSHLLDDQDS